MNLCRTLEILKTQIFHNCLVLFLHSMCFNYSIIHQNPSPNNPLRSNLWKLLKVWSENFINLELDNFQFSTSRFPINSPSFTFPSFFPFTHKKKSFHSLDEEKKKIFPLASFHNFFHPVCSLSPAQNLYIKDRFLIYLRYSDRLTLSGGKSRRKIELSTARTCRFCKQIHRKPIHLRINRP